MSRPPRWDRGWLTALRTDPWLRLAAIAVLVVAAVVVGLVLLSRPDEQAAVRLQQGAITVKRGLSTSSALFGDTIVAEVDVVTDDALIDSESVRLETDFRPYRVVETATDSARREGASLHRTVFRLRCLTSACLPSPAATPVRFAPLRVHYRLRGADREQRVPWRGVLVTSRLSGDPAAPEGIMDAPPVLSTGTRSPVLLQVAFGGLAVLLGLAGAALVVRALWPRFFYSLRRWRSLTPLAQSLLQVEAAAEIEDEAVRRSVLDRLSGQLDAARAPELGVEARRLAWGPAVPDADDLTGLAEKIRRAAGAPRR